jgi:uncharacterized protein
MALVIRNSKIHASGCYTTVLIKKRTLIVEYTGPRLTVHYADALYDNCRKTYLFGLDDGKHIIDGDGVAAFINHSCAPNCEPDEIKGRVWIIAQRNIKAGEELTYDYNLYDGDLDESAPCHCGAANCRGSMFSEEELARRAKLKNRVKKVAKSPSKKSRVKAERLRARLAAERRRAAARRRQTRIRYSEKES